MSRKDEIGLEGQSDLLQAERQISLRSTRSRDAIRGKGAIRGVRPEQEEFLLAQLVGISADQIRTWPEIVRLLEDAQGRDWSRPMVVVPPDGDARGLTVRTFGSFEAVYAELVEPWLGSWAELQKTYARFKKGEVTQEQGAEEIQLRAKAGRPKKGEECAGLRALSRSETKDRTLARLRRDDPDLATQVERGELTANAAAVAKGWRKTPTRVERMRRDWHAATEDERAAFLAEIGAAIVGTAPRAA